MIINEAVTYNAPVRFNAGITRIVAQFKSGVTAPSVKYVDHYLANGLSAVTITNFVDGSECQSIYILGDGLTTISNNANIKTNTGANKLLAANRVYCFTKFNSVWYESVDVSGGAGSTPIASSTVTGTVKTTDTVGDPTVYRSAVVDTLLAAKAALSHTHAAGDVTSGTFADARIPNLDTAKITTGTFVDARIPNLDAAKTTTGTFDVARIPDLSANKITTDTLNAARLPATADMNGRVVIRNNGTLVGTRRAINLIPGTNVTLTITDDAGNEEVDVTINASGGSGSTRAYVPLHMGNRIWTNMTNAVRGSAQPLFNVLHSHGGAIDLLALGATEFRIIVVVEVVAASSGTLFVRYDDDAGFASPADLQSSGTTGDRTVISAGFLLGAWTTIAAGAKIANCHLKAYGFGSNGTADPVFPTVAVEFR